MKKRNRKVILCIFIIFIFVGYCFFENNVIDVERIDLNVKNLGEDMEGIKIAHVSDLHLKRNNFFLEGLEDKLREEKPDLIFITGDLVDRTDNIDEAGLGKVCKMISDIAPTYVISGNHDCDHNYEKWKKVISDSGAIVLDDKIEYYKKGNSKLALMGYKYDSEANISYSNVEQEIPVLLLAHKPDEMNIYFNKSNLIIPDIAFCGHAHGGQVRIPFINQGVVAPNQGLFPKYTSGVYESPYKNGKMVLSRGLGNSHRAPIRINDRIHLPIVILHGE